MSPLDHAPAADLRTPPVDDAPDPTPFVRDLPDGRRHLDLMVSGVHCAGCIRKIEGALTAHPAVRHARVNLSTRRLAVDWTAGEADPRELVARVTTLGFGAVPFDPASLDGDADREGKRLLAAMAVAGFAAANVMLLSVAVWSGHAGEMGSATRTLFHWISALIALPAVAYAGRPFFHSAWGALKGHRLNMDVPISLAVLLACGMSLYQTMQAGQHAYFDASVTLLFFLLVGRYLDRRARAKARSVATQLMALQTRAATVIADDGTHHAVRVADLAPGMVVHVATGERIPVDGHVASGESEVDTSLVTGESLPQAVAAGARIYAGTLNLSAPLTLRVAAAGEDTLLAEIVRLMEQAEQGRATYVRIADRVARFYAPAVHILAAGTFAGWLMLDTGWEPALMAAIAVLIITCPCALGLAVPVVQVVATGRLLSRGVLVKASDALERLARADAVVFDKTGTLTLGRPELVNRDALGAGDLAAAAALARESRHPLSRAVVRAAAAEGLSLPAVDDVAEVPGRGLEGTIDGIRVRLGSGAWCGGGADSDGTTTDIWLQREGGDTVRLAFADTLRSDAADTVRVLKARGLHVELLSGDREAVVRDVAAQLGIDAWRAECLPQDKVRRLEALAAEGRRPLMAGDGLNDAPALAAGFVSISPALAADVSRTAADLVFQGERLDAVVAALDTARKADGLVKQNFGLAFAYNAIAIPLAVAGLATPLVAAIAMSSSSLIVTLNALRLRLGR